MQVDVKRYWTMVRENWSWLDFQAIQRLEIAGRIFRNLDAIYWELPSLKYHRWLKYTMDNMAIYGSWMDDAIQGTGWQT